MKQTAVDYLQDEILQDRMIKAKSIKEWNDVISKAKEMEEKKEYETKAYWFGRGILAGRENKIKELQPKKTLTNEKTS